MLINVTAKFYEFTKKSQDTHTRAPVKIYLKFDKKKSRLLPQNFITLRDKTTTSDKRAQRTCVYNTRTQFTMSQYTQRKLVALN